MVAVAEIAIAIAVVGWFLAPTIKELMDSARSSVGSRYKWYTGLPGKLQELAQALDEINVIVGAARGNFVNDPAMIDVLWGLKDAIHDAEELLDTFQYKILDANLNLEKRHPVRRAVDSTVDFGKQMIGSKKSLNKLKKLLKRLDLLRQRSRDLIQASQRGSRPISRLGTAPLPRKDKLFGYDNKYEDLVSNLNSGYGCSRVVAIIGDAGMGKTELARQAFHDPKLKFSLRIWVSVYAKFSATELLREIWGSTPVQAKPLHSRWRESENMNLTSLQEELTKMLKSGGRCLLVLDDVCNDESASASDLSRRETWDKVLAPFKHYSQEGSRILITSRAGICCKTLGAGAPIVLNGIDTGAITLLLKKACFGNEDARIHKKLQGLFHNHVLKTHGSPLAAQEVGSMLEGSRDPAKWKDKLNSGYPDRVRHAHLSSYQDLPPHLQRCFAFCSIFPINWRFQPEKLIRMWVALGFVECSLSESGGKKTDEDVAGEYFQALLQRSFFKEAATAKDKSDYSGFYVIHEHTHSMLRLVSPRTYLTIDSNRDRGALIPLTVRHISVTTSCLDQLKDSGELIKLRTLLVFNDDASTSPESARVTAIDNGVLKKFKGVRVLDFSDTSIAHLPESVGELKHLRYLDLPNTITTLGCHVTKLLLLQTFSVNKNGRFHELEDLPDEMSNLTNLRHLDLYMKCIEKIERIGRLDKLQGSVEFCAGKSEEGHGIRELGKLNSLRRMLSIKGLETVTSREDAERAELHKKEYLKVLKLEWGQQTLKQQNQRGAAPNDSAVLEGLKPHPDLEKLHIIRYLGTTTPAWLVNPSVLANLRALYLKNCRNLQVLPLVGKIPRLEVLTISELCSVKRIDGLFSSGAFSSLEKMVIHDMPMLDAWNEGVVSIDTPILFPLLREVKIAHCPKLCSVAGLLSCRLSLMDLRVETCPNITQTFSKSSFPLLNDLSKLRGCPGLQFEDSPAEGAAAPCPTQDCGRCIVPTCDKKWVDPHI